MAHEPLVWLKLSRWVQSAAGHIPPTSPGPRSVDTEKAMFACGSFIIQRREYRDIYCFSCHVHTIPEPTQTYRASFMALEEKLCVSILVISLQRCMPLVQLTCTVVGLEMYGPGVDNTCFLSVFIMAGLSRLIIQVIRGGDKVIAARR